MGSGEPEKSMGETESEAAVPPGERSRSTLVLKTEVFEPEDDRILELLNQWEAFRSRGEEPPADWTRAIDPCLRE